MDSCWPSFSCTFPYGRRDPTLYGEQHGSIGIIETLYDGWSTGGLCMNGYKALIPTCVTTTDATIVHIDAATPAPLLYLLVVTFTTHEFTFVSAGRKTRIRGVLRLHKTGQGPAIVDKKWRWGINH